MDKLRLILEKYSRWQLLIEYVNRIELAQQSNFPASVENSKSLLESIAKEICTQRKQPLENNESVSKLLRLSFASLGYRPSETINQIGQAIANVGQQMGNLRNEIGDTSHGKTLEELRAREGTVNSLTSDFLMFSTELVCCFLIEAFETENPLVVPEPEISFKENVEFNEYWNEIYGEFRMTDDYTYSASGILFNVDPEAYKSELNTFNSLEIETPGGEHIEVN